MDQTCTLALQRYHPSPCATAANSEVNLIFKVASHFLFIMKYLIEDLYKLLDFDWYDINFYDLYYALQSPVKVTYEYTADDGSTRDVTFASE